MRTIEEQQHALSCLSLAVQHMDGMGDSKEALALAAKFYAFVTGEPEKGERNSIPAHHLDQVLSVEVASADPKAA